MVAFCGLILSELDHVIIFHIDKDQEVFDLLQGVSVLVELPRFFLLIYNDPTSSCSPIYIHLILNSMDMISIEYLQLKLFAYQSSE